MYNKGWYKVEKDDSVRNLVSILEPLIADLEENKKILSESKEELEKVSRLIAYTKDNIQSVGVYADQELITSNLDKIYISIDDYKACCYLLKSENDQVKMLPQYVQARNLISDIIEFFKLHKAELIVETNELSGICEKKEKEKRYYDVLSCPNPLIENSKEFVEFMKEHGLSDEEIIKILYSTIYDNVVNYGLKKN